MIWMDVDTALSEVPVNSVPLTDDTDFKTVEESVAYNAAGLELIWHFVTTAGAYSATVVTPTTGGSYDWAHQDGGMYTIEIPASGGASINNDTEGFGYFTGKATGVLPWRGPTIGFRASGLNDLLTDSAYSTTRGLAGTALPAAAADAAGGLPISDAGGLDLDAQRSDVAAILVDTGTTLQGELDGIQADTEDIQSRLPAALVGGRVDSSVGAMATNVLTAAAAATDFSSEVAAAVWDEALAGHTGVDSAGERLGRVPNAAAGGNGGLPTVDANNYVAGLQGTKNQLDDLNDLTQANVRSATGLAAANLDTQLDAIPTAAENAAALLAAGDVDGFTLEQTLKLCLAALAGKLSGAATTTVTIRAADDSRARITATVDADGNRSVVTLDAAG